MIKKLIKKLPVFKHILKYKALIKQQTVNDKQLALASERIDELSVNCICNKEKNTSSHLDWVISLTTYGERVKSVHLTIQSLLLQSVTIKKVVLWLAEDEFILDDLSRELLSLQQYGLEIYFCSDIRSYKKLIPALRKYPEEVIITFDDDVIYPTDHVERLLSAHQKYPNNIICHRAHKVTKDEQGRLKPYLQWQFDVSNDDSVGNYGKDIFPVGIGGVLYPPGCFDEEVVNEGAFMSLAPNADDIWFKVMALKNNIRVRTVDNPMPYNNYLLLPNSQQQSLWAENKTANDEQLTSVLNAYPEVRF